MKTPEYIKDKALSTGFIVGWFAGATVFILTFAVGKSVALATAFGLFFGVIFGWAVFNVMLNNYTKEK